MASDWCAVGGEGSVTHAIKWSVAAIGCFVDVEVAAGGLLYVCQGQKALVVHKQQQGCAHQQYQGTLKVGVEQHSAAGNDH